MLVNGWIHRCSSLPVIRAAMALRRMSGTTCAAARSAVALARQSGAGIPADDLDWVIPAWASEAPVVEKREARPVRGRAAKRSRPADPDHVDQAAFEVDLLVHAPGVALSRPSKTRVTASNSRTSSLRARSREVPGQVREPTPSGGVVRRGERRPAGAACGPDRPPGRCGSAGGLDRGQVREAGLGAQLTRSRSSAWCATRISRTTSGLGTAPPEAGRAAGCGGRHASVRYSSTLPGTAAAVRPGRRAPARFRPLLVRVLGQSAGDHQRGRRIPGG